MQDLLVLVPIILLCVRSRAGRQRSVTALRATGPHWRRCYSRRSFLRLGGVLVAAGAMAHTGVDEAVDRWHTRTVRSPASDAAARICKLPGQNVFFAVWALAAGVDATIRSSRISRWGRRNFEATLVGLPLLWTVQRLLGGARPIAGTWGPSWRPLASDHAASGHTFLGAIPWLNLARDARGGPGRTLALLASTLTGWSRLNDRMHYLSQIILGYSIAWTAVAAVREGDAVADGDTAHRCPAPPDPAAQP